MQVAFFEGLRLAERELLLFAAFWFLVGSLDEIAVDVIWLGVRFARGRRADMLPRGYELRPLNGRLAIFVAAWREPHVIGQTIAHALAVWPQRGFALYVGCYCNDGATLAAAMAGAGTDPRVRIVVHERPGPTTKADCLNRLYRAMAADEERAAARFTGVVIHDAEDMVHSAELALIDRMLEGCEFVQLPVRPEPQAASRWIAGHYSDEFTEHHAKTLVVRDALGAAIPAAGVGCGFARAALAQLARTRAETGEAGPFAQDSLTEDYELGLLLARGGARSRFVRVRDSGGALVATRAFFPATVREAVRQKTRWIHGIALQGWDRLGWGGRFVDVWMTLRDRRGPMIAVVLTAAYALVVVEGLLALADFAGVLRPWDYSPLVKLMTALCFAAFVWRVAWRFAFTAREYGVWEGLRSVVRVPIANVIAIMAGRRALAAYIETLRGARLCWDKTEHRAHPAPRAGLTAR